MKGTLLRKDFLSGSNALVELVTQEFILKCIRKDLYGLKEMHAQGAASEAFAKRYAYLLCLVAALFEPRLKGFAVSRTVKLEIAIDPDQDEMVSQSFKVESKDLISFKNNNPILYAEVARHVWHSDSFKFYPLESFFIRRHRDHVSYLEGGYELLILDQPDGPCSGGGLDSMPLGFEPDPKVPRENFDQQSSESWKRYTSFDWSPESIRLDPRVILRVVFLQNFHPMVIRRALFLTKDASILRCIQDSIPEEELTLLLKERPTALELFESEACIQNMSKAARTNFFTMFFASANLMIAAVEEQNLVPKNSLVENDVHDVLRRLGKMRGRQLGNQQKLGIKLHNLSIPASPISTSNFPGYGDLFCDLGDL